LNLIPFATVKLERADNTFRTLKLYPKYRIDQEGKLITEATINSRALAIDRYHATLENGEFLLTQHRVLQKILWGYQSFYEK